MNTHVWRNGAIGSAIIVIISLVTGFFMGTYIGYSEAEVIGYISIFAAMFFVYLGVKTYRDKDLNGFIDFGPALKVGTLIALLPSIAFGVYTILFFYVAGDFFAEQFLQNAPPEQVAQFEGNMGLFMNPYFQGLIMFATVFIIGFLVALVSALILKRKSPELAS